MTTGKIVSRPDSQEVGIAVVVDRDQSPAKTSKFLPCIILAANVPLLTLQPPTFPIHLRLLCALLKFSPSPP